MQCPVCYESDFENGDLLWLQCLHPLCRRCLKKLVRRMCPLCRSDIKAEIGRDEKPKSHTRPYSDSVVRIRARRRRRRHTSVYTDEIVIDNGRSILVESYENNVGAFKKRSTKNPNKRGRFKKGKWAKSYGHSRGNRLCKAS